MNTVKLTAIKRTENSFQIEVRERITKNTNVLALLNEGDERFNQGKEQLCWTKVTAEAAEKHFGIPANSINSLKVGEQIELDIENPKMNGKELHIQITETTIGDEWDIANMPKSIKQIEVSSEKFSLQLGIPLGDRAYFVEKFTGKPIFSKKTLVIDTAEHKFLNTEMVSKDQLAGINIAQVSKVKSL